MAYHPFLDEDGEEIGSFEAFEDGPDNGRNFDVDGLPVVAGWYWWPCFPGCLPDNDGSAEGPFKTEALAIAAARE